MCRALNASRMISPFRVLVDHRASYVTVTHCVHHGFQISGLRQHEAAEVVARTIEDELARQPRSLPRARPLPVDHPFPNVLSV
jgi:hypothetical protein